MNLAKAGLLDALDQGLVSVDVTQAINELDNVRPTSLQWLKVLDHMDASNVHPATRDQVRMHFELSLRAEGTTMKELIPQATWRMEF